MFFDSFDIYLAGSLLGELVHSGWSSIELNARFISATFGITSTVGRLTTIKGEEVTSLPGFEASFTTKSGVRVIAHSDRANGAVLTYLQFEDSPRIPLSSVQIQQLGVLLQQGRKKLDALKAGN